MIFIVADKSITFEYLKFNQSCIHIPTSQWKAPLIEAGWRIYASLNWVITDLDNGHYLNQCSFIGVRSYCSFNLWEQIWVKFESNIKIFIYIEENTFRNVVCKMAAPLSRPWYVKYIHYNDVIMGTKAYEVTSLTIVYSSVYSGADERKHQSSASLAFVRGIHRWPVNSSHKEPVKRKIFPFDDIIMLQNYPFSVPFLPLDFYGMQYGE